MMYEENDKYMNNPGYEMRKVFEEIDRYQDRIVDQVVEFRSFIYVVDKPFLDLIAVNNDDIAGEKSCVDITAVDIIFGIIDSDGTHSDDLLSAFL